MAGASIVCTPGFSAPKFFVWMAEFRPTWYTAVPTIHQAILARAASQPRDHYALSAAVHPLSFRLFAAAGSYGVRKSIQYTCD